MTLTNERRYGVWLYDQRVGTLNQRGDYTWFNFSGDYLGDPDRSVLGLVFEEDLYARHASALRLPPWFSNLLPEGHLRDWVALDRGVSADREMELLAQVGQDLPGAVRVLAEDDCPEEASEPPQNPPVVLDDTADGDEQFRFRFSLAGVGLKFSMLREGERLTLPAFGQGGDWIVKLPDLAYVDVPRNEFAMMSLGRAAGLDVPECMLVQKDQILNLPDGVWNSVEQAAYAVRRFDRDHHRNLIHIEDFAQVRNVYPGRKYQGNLETVAALIYRQRDDAALQEFARRVAFNVLISNGDAHLKNWSLIYRDRRIPTLSPAYDLVSTSGYMEKGGVEDLGLKFGGSRRFDRVSIELFRLLEKKLGASSANLVECVVDTVERTLSAWPDIASVLRGNETLQRSISESIQTRSRQLLKRSATI